MIIVKEDLAITQVQKRVLHSLLCTQREDGRSLRESGDAFSRPSRPFGDIFVFVEGMACLSKFDH